MKARIGISIVAIIEVLIGSITIAAVIISLLQSKSSKPPEVLAFVLTTAAISTMLGFGILKKDIHSYHLLLYFASVIILSKILIFAGVITLNGALETAMPSYLKNIISILYHSLLILYLTRKHVKEHFGERRDTIFSLKMPFSKWPINTSALIFWNTL